MRRRIPIAKPDAGLPHFKQTFAQVSNVCQLLSGGPLPLDLIEDGQCFGGSIADKIFVSVWALHSLQIRWKLLRMSRML